TVMGKEAALFLPTGTMGNTCAIAALTSHGQEVICDSRCHILNYELSMMAWFAGCVARPITTDHGLLTWSQIRREIRLLGPHWAPTGLIEVENTHNMAGGTVYSLDALQEIHEGAHEMRLPVHMDGARVFHAAAALDVPVERIVRHADTVMLSLSKGLAAPVGSMLAGPAEVIEKARLLRKRLGGGMRQAGILAAAGLIALEQMPLRLHEDHRNAAMLATLLAGIPGVAVRPVATNIVIFDISGTGLSAVQLSSELKDRGVIANGISATELRMVTHCDVSEGMCRTAAEAVSDVLAAVR
ncbi:MAG TPA: GntG family PLP-dependent aldolase, partial [Bryobacteraceae bacterium]|nr:GntG family PLP-dependent aldolase [Bryobacteraceae bacterium]